MKKRIDILKRNDFCYTYEAYAAESLRKSLNHLGIQSKVLTVENFHEVLDDPPTMTCSFQPLFPNRPPLCSLTKIPHLLLKDNGLSPGFHYLKEPLAKIGINCRATESYLLTQGISRAFFLPNPAPPFQGTKEKIYDAVLFENLIDREEIFKTWDRLFSKQEKSYLKHALETLEKDSSLFPLKVLTENLKNMESPLCGIDDWACALSEAIPTRNTLALLESISSMHFHLFGEHVGNLWLKRLKNSQNIHLHSVLPFSLHFEVLKQAKFFIRTSPANFDGSDPWLLWAIAAGCFIFTPPNTYLEEMLGKDSPFFYPEGAFSLLEEKLHFYLENEEKRKATVVSHSHLLKKYNWEWYTKSIVNFCG